MSLYVHVLLEHTAVSVLYNVTYLPNSAHTPTTTNRAFPSRKATTPMSNNHPRAYSFSSPVIRRAIAVVCLCLSVVFSYPKQSRGDIIVKPWDVNAAVFKTDYNAIPVVWKKKGEMICVESLSPREMLRVCLYIYPDSTDVEAVYQNIMGLYLPKLDIDSSPNNLPDSLPIILIADNVPRSKIFDTFCHEYGHHVWHCILNNEERETFEKIYTVEKILNQLPTDYSGASVMEAFAESYSCYLRKQRLSPMTTTFFIGVETRVGRMRHTNATAPTLPLSVQRGTGGSITAVGVGWADLR